MSILCDRMCATKKMVSIFRHGINNDDIGPIAKASFEETPEMFLKAAKHAELDLMTGVSANVMCGQEGYFGTGAFQVLVNLPEMIQLGEKIKEKTENVDDLLNLENVNDVCSTQSLVINTDFKNNENEDTGLLDDDYDVDFKKYYIIILMTQFINIIQFVADKNNFTLPDNFLIYFYDFF